MNVSGKMIRCALLAAASWMSVRAFAVVCAAERKMGEAWQAATRVGVQGGAILVDRAERLNELNAE
jgi:hypothetical protein